MQTSVEQAFAERIEGGAAVEDQVVAVLDVRDEQAVLACLGAHPDEYEFTVPLVFIPFETAEDVEGVCLCTPLVMNTQSPSLPSFEHGNARVLQRRFG